MLSKSNLILAAAPTEMMAAQSFGLTLAHMAYRVGGGPHLFRANLPIPARGGSTTPASMAEATPVPSARR